MGRLRPVARCDFDGGKAELLGQVERLLEWEVADGVSDQSDLHIRLISWWSQLGDPWFWVRAPSERKSGRNHSCKALYQAARHESTV